MEVRVLGLFIFLYSFRGEKNISLFLKAALHCEHLTAIKGFLAFFSCKADTLRLLGSAQEVSGQPGSRRDHLFRTLGWPWGQNQLCSRPL